MDERLCGCGCGEAVSPRANYRPGHHWRAKRIAAGMPEEKICERCGETYRRDEAATDQSHQHWLARRFCSEACRLGWTSEDYEDHAAAVAELGATFEAGRQRARRIYRGPLSCEVCGAPAERHHRDGNPVNNEPENIAFLCRKHHIEVEDRLSWKRRDPAQRKARVKAYMAEYHRKRWAAMTPEQMEAHRARSRESMRRYRERKRRENAG